jgi:chitodextrinase
MALPGQRVYQSGVFEAIGLGGQLLVALPNLDVFAGPSGLWLRVGGLALAALYVSVLLLRAFLPDRVLESTVGLGGPLERFQVKLRAGNRPVIAAVTALAVLVAGVSLFGARLLGLDSDASSPHAPPNLRSTGATARQVDLAWDAAADEGTGVREYRVTRRDNGLARTSPSTAFHDTLGIGGGVTYYYRVVAVDGAGNVSLPAELSVTTPVSDPAACAVDTAPPAQPANLRATVVTSTAATLEWDAAADVGSCGLAGYRVLRDGQDTGIVAAGTVVTEDGLEPDHSYVYSLVARDNAGNESPASAGLSVTTLARPVQASDPCRLGVPTALRSNGRTTTTVSLAWSAPSDACHLDGYRVFRGGTPVGSTGNTSYVVTGLTPGTGYVFTVRAHNSDGETSPSSNLVSVATVAVAPAPPAPPAATAAPDLTAPGVPTGLIVTDRTSSTAVVTWNPSTDTGGSGLKGYLVTVDGGPANLTTSTSTTVTGPPTSMHTVTVAAVDNAGNQSAVAVLDHVRIGTGGPVSAPDEVWMPFDGATTVTVTVVNIDPDVCGAVELTVDTVGMIATVPVTDTATATFEFTVDVDGTTNPGGLVLDRYTDPYNLSITCGPRPLATVAGHPVVIGP